MDEEEGKKKEMKRKKAETLLSDLYQHRIERFLSESYMIAL